MSIARLSPKFSSALGRAHAGRPGRLRAAVQAAAENTSTFAIITGHAPMMAPYVTHIAAPSICTALSTPGRAQKYDATNTMVAAHPRISTAGVPMERLSHGLGLKQEGFGYRHPIGSRLFPLLKFKAICLEQSADPTGTPAENLI